MLVMSLRDGTRRFSELKRGLPGISQKMLTAVLRGLERDGYIARTVYPTVPPKVEYRLTDLGRELAEPVIALGQFAVQNRDRVLAARQRFDQAAAGTTASPEAADGTDEAHA
jgi:DNA-binding HxlR family transcriptional regulator